MSPLLTSDELFTLDNAAKDSSRPDIIRRFEIDGSVDTPFRISAEIRTEGVTGAPGEGCMVFFNVEYAQGPIFWDTFLYPDTGSTPWRTLSCEVRARGAVRVVEMHIRFQAKGRLQLRNLRIEPLELWTNDADVAVAIFGDSTDMTNYLPTDIRLGRWLELLLRDRFSEHRVDVHCLAEGGEYLQRLVDSGRLDRELQALPRCDIAMIRYGLNDVSQKMDPEKFRTQLHAACDIVLSRFPQAQLVLSTTIPPTAQAYDQQTQAVAEARKLPLIRLDQHIRQRSSTGEGDWHHQAGSRIGRHRTVNPPDNPDGLAGDIHPNAFGAQMIASHYFEHLEPIVARFLET